MEHYSALKNKDCHFAATWMGLEINILSESDREGLILYDITCNVESKK